MDDKLVMGLPSDGRSMVAPANRFRFSEKDQKSRSKYAFLPALMAGAIGAELAGPDDELTGLPAAPKPYDDEVVGSNPSAEESLVRIEEITRFLRSIAEEFNALGGDSEGAAGIVSVRLRYAANDVYSTTAYMERLVRAFQDNRAGSVNDNDARIFGGDDDRFRFPSSNIFNSPGPRDTGSGRTSGSPLIEPAGTRSDGEVEQGQASGPGSNGSDGTWGSPGNGSGGTASNGGNPGSGDGGTAGNGGNPGSGGGGTAGNGGNPGSGGGGTGGNGGNPGSGDGGTGGNGGNPGSGGGGTAGNGGNPGSGGGGTGGNGGNPGSGGGGTGGNGGNPGSGDGGRSNRLPVSAGLTKLSNTTINVSALILLDDLVSRIYDPDGDSLSVQDLAAAEGRIENYGPGRWLYTPERGALGEVIFSYKVGDGYGTINVQASMDLIRPAPREIVGTEGNDRLLGTPFEDIVSGSGGDDFIYGREADDILYGGEGSDTLLGGDGDDIVYGEAGDDHLFGGAGHDILFGGAGNDNLFGEDGDDILMAGVGDDVLAGGGGDDSLFGEEGDDVLFGDEGDDLLEGGEGNDDLSGGGGNDAVIGGAGNDVVRLGLVGEEERHDDQPETDGNDSYSGGTGVDTLDASAVGAGVEIDLAAGTATGETIGIDHVDGFENVVGSALADILTGDGNANVLEGGEGNDDLSGGGGNDAVIGGAGNDVVRLGLVGEEERHDDQPETDGNDSYSGGTGVDTLDASAVGAGVEIDLAAGTATGETIGIDHVDGFENVVGSALADILTGDGNANVLEGGEGNDNLSGGGGNDAVFGGAGDDVARLGLVGEEERHDDQPETDGNDSYSGGTGVDTLDASAVGAGVEIDLAAGTATGETIGIDHVDGFENVVGSALADILTGDGNANVLEGGEGNDELSGGGGNDAVIGGAGDDVVIIALRTRSETEEDADRSDGDVGHDCESGDGDDVYDGGDGIDTLDLSALIEAVIADLDEEYLEGPRIGHDAVSNFEIIRGGSGNDQLRGSNESDILYGGGGDDRLSGRDGDDILIGEDGRDELRGDDGNDTFLILARVSGESLDDGNDSFDGGDGADVYDASASKLGVAINLLTGIANGSEIGTDLLESVEIAAGGSGDDELTDGFGVTIMTGGAGNDIFVFVLQSASGSALDEIRDFEAGDRIDLSAFGHQMLFAGTGLEGEPQAGKVTFYHQQFEDGDRTIVRAIVDLEHDDDIEILLHGRYQLTEQDFIFAAQELGADAGAQAHAYSTS